MQTTNKGCGCGGGCGGKGGCGCGGSAGCGCKPARLPEAAPAPCSPCETASFVRPRFFAGQLLTEDDLEALIDYTVAKNRFHNARLFGAGVVCGLEVQCGPCDSTQIVVEPGYALDCCGNDLVLTCERVLDLAPMIRDLQARLKGSPDCTDPCPPVVKQTSERKEEEAKPKQYCLYAVYAERPDQPVAAYPVGDDCDAGRCEPTRILEGVTFELRCGPPDPAKTMCDAIKACKDVAGKQDELVALATAAARVAHQLRFTGSAAEASRDLHRINPEWIEAAIADKPAGDQFVTRYQTLATVGTLIASAQRQTKEIAHDTTGLTKYANQIADAILSTGEAAPTYLDRVLAMKVAQAWQASRDNAKTPYEGQLWDEDLSRASAETLKNAVAKLKQLAGCLGKVHTDCGLREAIDALTPSWSPDGESDFEKASGQLDAAIEIVERFLKDCECAAINPPCAPCENTGVLLACFEVDQCKVVRICNTMRTYVLAPTSLRYWGFHGPEAPGCCGKHERKPHKSLSPWGDYACLESAPMKRLAAARDPATVYDRLALERTPEDDTAALHEEIAEMRRRLEACERKLKERSKQ
jgi:hypothetical protein